MATIEKFAAKRFNDPDTLRLMDGNKVLGSAVWFPNAQQYRVRINGVSFWEDDEFCARKALEAGKSTTDQIEERLAAR